MTKPICDRALKDCAKTLAVDGACIVRGFLSETDVAALTTDFASSVAGERGVKESSASDAMIASDGPLGRLAAFLCDRPVRPVRVVRFDKTAETSWMVSWHQDRTIAVAAREDVEKFGPWSVKNGVVHVEPPVAMLEGMLTLRVFIDRCDEDQGPVELALGSHRCGRVPAAAAADVASSCRRLLATGGAGDVLAMRLLTVHASARSRSGARRRVLHVDYSADDPPAPLRWAGVFAE